ncbi:MAG: metallophosphoesterase [Fournierella sp.]|uniref:metallophosphoesterase n=1 Tax=Allofournierella sp. TaxID=1940256 RepID=UPI002A7FA4A4|nr:metallophosphoesterase [Fournierella sp.]MDY4167905.1 metallophosphoesterase [Fournierella sp.]
MKQAGKRWALLAAAVLLLAVLAAAGVIWYGNRGTKILVATDLHYLSPELNDHGACFEKTILNGDGKALAYIDELTDAFVEQVIREKPAALILSGDLTLNGEKQSHLDLAQKLRRITEAGIPVLALPGNHDLNSSYAVRFTGKTYESAENLKSAQFDEVYADLGYNGASARDEASRSYVFPLSDVLRVLMVDVNVPGSEGVLKPETLDWVKAQLEEARQAGARVIAVSHQNLLAHSDQISAGFVMGGAEELLALYEEYDVICNLSGHIHMQHTAESENGFFEAATGSLAVSPNQYARLTVRPHELDYRTVPVDVSGWAKEQGSTDANLLDFAAYSADFFCQVNRGKVIGWLQKEENGEEMADFFAQVNLDYFQGRPDRYDREDPMFEVWQESGAFYADYVESIRQEPAVNHNQATLEY